MLHCERSDFSATSNKKIKCKSLQGSIKGSLGMYSNTINLNTSALSNGERNATGENSRSIMEVWARKIQMSILLSCLDQDKD